MEVIKIHNPKTGRVSSLTFGGKQDTPGSLRVVGALPHNSEITLSKDQALKLIMFLQENILGIYENI